MDRLETSPTLLVFTLGARCESRRRQLLPRAQMPLEDSLHQACLDATIAAGRAIGCRIEVSSPLELALPADVVRREQRGADFGSRIERAMDESFAENGGAVVLVGSDVPDLEAGHLRRTLEALEEDPDRVVIGPSPDGGIYLLASTRPLGAALARVRWCCRETRRSLEAALAREGRRVLRLSPLADLDRRADLERWLSTGTTSRRWRGALHHLIERLGTVLTVLRQAWGSEPLAGTPRWTSDTASQRGPPGLAARA
ncbi:MAG: DUF2064 domain-containing protein [bacterium]|nr:DUF2064 domain-containing protein [bacterium]